MSVIVHPEVGIAGRDGIAEARDLGAAETDPGGVKPAASADPRAVKSSCEIACACASEMFGLLDPPQARKNEARLASSAIAHTA